MKNWREKKMALPEKTTPPKGAIEDFSILLYGAPGVGKTTFGASVPGHLFLATEPGQDGVECLRMDTYTWEDFVAAARDVNEDQHSDKPRVRMVVVDTADALYRMAEESVLKEFGQKFIGDGPLGYGKGGNFARERFMRMLRALAKLPCGVLLLSHAIDVESQDETGSKVLRKAPALPEKIRAELLGWVSIIGYVDTEVVRDGAGNRAGLARRVHTESTRAFEAKDRSRKLRNPIPLDWREWVKAFSIAESNEV
jgi:GTPase SAR1 family protein